VWFVRLRHGLSLLLRQTRRTVSMRRSSRTKNGERKLDLFELVRLELVIQSFVESNFFSVKIKIDARFPE
jgi:hypothetical protein